MIGGEVVSTVSGAAVFRIVFRGDGWRGVVHCADLPFPLLQKKEGRVGGSLRELAGVGWFC